MAGYIENGMYNPIVKVDRILNSASELRRILIEKEESDVAGQDIQARKYKALNKKYMAAVNSLEDETAMTSSLLTEIQELEKRIEIMHREAVELGEKYANVRAERDRLRRYKRRKHRALRQWLRRRMKKRR
jgi:hypothetical protein